MEKEIPKISFDAEKALDVEVISFTDLYRNLGKTKGHDPFAAHKIKFYCILIATQNTYNHFVDFNTYTLLEGSALFIAKNQVHHFTKDLLRSNGFCIIFSSAFMERNYYLSETLKLNRLFNYHIETPVIHQEEMGQDSFVGIAQKLYDEYVLPNDFVKSEMMRALIHVLLLKAERAKEVQAVHGIKPYWLEIFSTFKDMLEKAYINSRSAQVYASELNISYKFLNDVVKRLTGKTAKAFIDDFVTMEIKRYLVSTPFSIKEISYKTGFEEPGNMIKFFKKNTQTTPLKFRQNRV